MTSRSAQPWSRRSRSNSSRTCACTLTSRAVVGSSATMSTGEPSSSKTASTPGPGSLPSAPSAMASITRWRRPPDSSWGHWRIRCCGSGTPAWPRFRRARVGAHPPLGQLGAYAHGGVQRGERILEDRAQQPAAHGPPLWAGAGQHVDAGDADRAADRGPARLGGQAQQAGGQHALARPRLPDESQHLARTQIEAHASQGMDPSVGGVEAHVQVAHLRDGLSRPGPQNRRSSL